MGVKGQETLRDYDDKATSPYIDDDINDFYSAVFGYKAEGLQKQ